MIDWLIGTLVATSALMALVLVIREPVRRRFGASVAYALWLIPALRMVLPPLTRTVERIVPEASGSVFTAGFAISLDPAPVGLVEKLGGWPSILVALWLAGTVAMLVRGLATYWAQRRAILAGAIPLAELDGIRLLRSECVRGPLAFGIFDRVIVLPLDFDQRFSERQRRLALDHELAHHRSGDLVANSIAFVLLCLQWFNPLAWAAHAAFRFDQEAACDARVLDKVGVGDRSSYGETIAKAACGRVLLFAGALDRPSTLSRRLTLMTRMTNRGRRKFGYFLVGGGLLLGLPLTATWAVNYVDVQDTASSAPAAPARSAARLPVAESAAPAPAALIPAGPVPAAAPQEMDDGSVKLPGGVTLDKGSIAFLENDSVIIDGKIKRLDELSPSQRSKLRGALARSRQDLVRERAELPARLAEVKREIDRIRSGEYKREIIEAREDLQRDLAEVESEAAVLRATGQDPRKLKAEILESLREAEAIDIDKAIREELAELNPDQLIAELRNAEEQMARLQIKLDQLDRR